MTADPSLSSLRGQDRAIARLSRILSGGLRSGAILLWGPEGVGKRTTALALSRRILCAEPGEREPCGRCLSCRTPLATHPDFHVLDPGETQSIGIDAVRKLLRETLESSLVSPVRIALLDDVHRLTPEASNSLLKSLEEPSDNLLFFLLSPSPDRLLPTLLSRLLKVRFVSLSDGDLLAVARELRPESSPEEIERAGVLSGGSVGRLLTLLDSPLTDPLSRVASLLEGMGSGGRVDFAAVWESFPALAEKEGFDVFLDALERLLLSAERVAGGHAPLPEWAESPLPALYAAEGPDFLRGSLHDKIGEMRRLSVHNINRGLALEQFLGWIGELFSLNGSGK
ncbi:MAG: AAA family ATPase [Leptospirillia bacterium]